jgi:hypothetical protein
VKFLLIFLAAKTSFDWLTHVLSLVIGLFLGIITEPFRLWLFRPRLAITFVADEHCLRETPVRVTAAESVFSSHAKVVRFYVANTSRFLARGCLGYLVRVEQLSPGNSPPAYLCRSVATNLGLYRHGANRHSRTHWVILRSRRIEPADCRLTPHTEPKPTLFQTIFREHATYRFTATVAGENFTPITTHISIDWKGDWDICDVWTNNGNA